MTMTKPPVLLREAILGLKYVGGSLTGFGVDALLLHVGVEMGLEAAWARVVSAELTPVGADSIITRLVEDPAGNVERWKKLPYLMDYQEAGTPKPGAVVLAQLNAGNQKLPLLITQNYGRGRTAVLATSGTWRWQMSQPLGDPELMFVLFVCAVHVRVRARHRPRDPARPVPRRRRAPTRERA